MNDDVSPVSRTALGFLVFLVAPYFTDAPWKSWWTIGVAWAVLLIDWWRGGGTLRRGGRR